MILGRVMRLLDGSARVQLVNGLWIDFDDPEQELVPSDLVFIDEADGQIDWLPAPDEHWPVRPVAARFIKMDGDMAVVQQGGIVTRAPIATDLEVQKGADVWLDDYLGVIGLADLVTVDASAFKVQPEKSGMSLADFAGYPELVRRTRKLLDISLEKGDLLIRLGARPIRGVLFWGLPGTGKTLLARIIAANEGADFYLINGPEIISKWVGDSEAELRQVFRAAREGDRPAIIFIDEIDSVAPARSGDSHEASKRLVAQLLTEMDGFRSNDQTIVIGATNRREDLDPALRRPGRFDWEIHFPLPSQEDRMAILSHLAAKGGQVNLGTTLMEIAAKTEQWSGAELTAIWAEAAMLAVSDGRQSIVAEDLHGAVDVVVTDRGKKA